MERDTRFRRLQFRAWHRGTREADYMMGGFFDRYATEWNEEQLHWFEQLLEIDDPFIMDWALGKSEPPAQFQGDMMESFRKLDFIEVK